jgi:hypothetical protein
MKFAYPLLALLFIITYCSKTEIISIPENATDYSIKTKKGVIRYSVENRDKIIEIKYVYIEGIEGLASYSPPQIEGASIFTSSTRVTFTIYKRGFNIINFLLCDLLYQTGYISRKVYSVENGEKNIPYKYFGGTPSEIVKDLNKFIFYKDDIPEIQFNRQGEIIYFNPWDSYEFSEENDNNCASFSAIDEFKDLFFLIDVFKFKIGENIITIKLKNENEIEGKADSEFNFYKYPCEKWVFGMNVLNSADVREFNLETGDVTLYLSQGKDAIVDVKSGDF